MNDLMSTRSSDFRMRYRERMFVNRWLFRGKPIVVNIFRSFSSLMTGWSLNNRIDLDTTWGNVSPPFLNILKQWHIDWYNLVLLNSRELSLFACVWFKCGDGMNGMILCPIVLWFDTFRISNDWGIEFRCVPSDSISSSLISDTLASGSQA